MTEAVSQETDDMEDDMEIDVAAVPESTELAIPDFRDKRLAEHAVVIKKRNELMRSEMTHLAKALFAMTLYTEQGTALVENCKFAVSLNAGATDVGAHRLFVSFYLKDTEDDKQITWRDMVNSDYIKSLLHDKKPFKSGDVISVAKDYILARDIKPEKSVPLTLRGKRKQDAATIGTYGMVRNDAVWSIIQNDLPAALIKLLPAANVLVQAELDILKEEAEDAIAFVEAFEEEM